MLYKTFIFNLIEKHFVSNLKYYLQNVSWIPKIFLVLVKAVNWSKYLISDTHIFLY